MTHPDPLFILGLAMILMKHIAPDIPDEDRTMADKLLRSNPYFESELAEAERMLVEGLESERRKSP